jgi:integrase
LTDFPLPVLLVSNYPHKGDPAMNITTRPLSTNELVMLVSKTPTPWKQIYFLAAYSGLRISDLLQLPWSSCPPYSNIVEIKTHKFKKVIWSDLAQAHWNALFNFGLPRKPLFPYYDPSTFRKAIQSDCKRLGIDTFRVAFHSLRKTHAVIAYKEGGILQAKVAMNHSKLSTTETYIENALKMDTYSTYDTIFQGSR